MSFCCSNKSVRAKENSPLDENQEGQEPCGILDAVIALGGLGCAECCNVCTPSAFHITLKCIKHIGQVAKGSKASERFSQEGHLQAVAAVTGVLAGNDSFSFPHLFISPHLAVNNW